jgi:glutamate synthase domain-containing protein 3
MAAFNVFGNCATVAQMEDGAMYALAQKETPEKALKEVLKLAEKGEQITQKKAKEIIKKHMETKVEQDNTPSTSSPVEHQPAKPQPQLTKDEQMKAERKKAKSYAEYLQRSVDDLNRIVRSPLHPELIKLCGQIIKGLEQW